MSTPASSPTTNPHRTNNPREESRATRSRPSSEVPTYNEPDEKMGAGDEEINPAPGPSRDAIKKLDQIIQAG
jgi:autophagy-related protein 13